MLLTSPIAAQAAGTVQPQGWLPPRVSEAVPQSLKLPPHPIPI